MGRIADLLIRIGTQDNASGSLRSLESSVIRTVGSISAAIAAVSSILFPVVQAAQFEREMANAARTTGYTDTQISRLSTSLVRISTELGTAAIDLAKVSSIAGQLGVSDQGRKAMEAFTESVARSAVTLEMTVEAAANFGAQISAIFGKSIAEVERVFSSVNEVAVDSVAAASDLFDVLKRVGNISGATFEQVTALAATMTQLGVPNEQAGTALVKFIGNMLAESEKFAKGMGVSQSEWVKKVNANALDALKSVLVKIAGMEDAEGAALTKKLFGAGRLYSAAAKLIGDAAQGFPILDKMLASATRGYDEGTSSMNAYAKIMDTVVKQIDVLKASFTGLSLAAGEQSLPVIKEAVEQLSAAMRDPEVIAYFAKVGTGIASIIASVANNARAIANLDVEWTNVAKTVATVGSIIVSVFAGKVLLAITRLLLPIRSLGLLLNGLSTVRAFGPVVAFFARIAPFIALFGGWPVILGAAAVSLIYFRKEIGTFIADLFGQTDKATAELKRREEAAKREAAKANADIIAAAEERNSLLNKTMFNADGGLQRKPYLIGAAITEDAETASTRVKQLLDDLGQSYAGVTENSKALTATRSELVTLEERRLQLVAREREVLASTNVEELEAARQRATEFLKNNSQKNWYSRDAYLESSRGAAHAVIDANGKAIEDYKAKLSAVQVELGNVVAAQERGRINMAAYIAEMTKQGDAADNVFTPEFLSRFDKSTALYLRQTNAINAMTAAENAAKGAMDEIERKRKKDQDGQYTGTQQADVSKLTAEREKWKKEREALEKARGDNEASMDVVQTQVASIVRSVSPDKLRETAEAVKNLAVSHGSASVAMARSQASQATFAYHRTNELKKEWAGLANAAKSFEKSAKSALDNTGNEVDALYNRMARFKLDLQDTLSTRGQDSADKEALSKIDHEYDVKRQRIITYWDERAQLSRDGTSKEYYEEQKYQALKRLDEQKRGAGSDYTAQASEKRIALLIAETKALIDRSKASSGVDASATGEKAPVELSAAQRAAKQKEYTALLAQSIVKLEGMSAAEKEAALASADAAAARAQAIKKELDASKPKTLDLYGASQGVEKAKDKIKEIEKELNDIAKMEGRTPGMFVRSEEQVVELRKQLESLYAYVGEGIPVINQGVADEATKRKEATEAAATFWAKANEDAEKTVKAIGLVMTGSGDMLREGATIMREAGLTLGPASKDFLEATKGLQIGALSVERIAELAKSVKEALILDQAAFQALEHRRGPQGVAGNIAPIAAPVVLKLDRATSLSQADRDRFIQSMVNDPVVVPLGFTYDDLELNTQAVQDAAKKAGVVQVPVTWQISTMFTNMEMRAAHAQVDSMETGKISAADGFIKSLKVDKVVGLEVETTGAPNTGSPFPMNRALGGPIHGPGSGTSDSIPVWASNGEYMIDAVTTSVFGSGFFRGLQMIARGGSQSRLKSGLPAMAGGGPVAGVSKVGSVDITVGGKAFTLYGEAKQAADFVDTMSRLKRR